MTALLPAFRFTRHAVDRFAARVWPALASRPIADDREALSILCGAASHVEATPGRTARGHALWSVREPAMRWVSKPDTWRGRRVAVVVTVLGATEDADAEEQAELAVVEAARRLVMAPVVGEPEATIPPPPAHEGFALKSYRAWIALETQRLSVERDRLKTLRTLTAATPAPRPAPPRVDPMSEKTERVRLAVEAQRAAAEARERGITERHRLSMARDAMLVAMADRLAEIDPVGSAELIARVRAFRCAR